MHGPPPQPQESHQQDAPVQPARRPNAVVFLLGAAAIGALLGVMVLLVQSTVVEPLGATTQAPTPDPFDSVRREAQQAFERGTEHYQRGELELALIELDRARLNDPDDREDIRTMLESVVEQLRSQQPLAEPTSPPPPAATSTPYTVVLPQAQPTQTPAPTVEGQPEPAGVAAPNTTRYTSNAERFRLDVPANWEVTDEPSAEAGVGVVAFSPPSGEGSFVVSVDRSSQAVSPELYSAHLETIMSDLPGYSLESVSPVTVQGAAAWQRRFSVTRGNGGQMTRTLQVVIGQRSTVFILTASAPADRFAVLSPVFNQIVRSFQVVL